MAISLTASAPARTWRNPSNSAVTRTKWALILIGMWLERYVIVVTSLHRDFLPSSWGMYSGTAWDVATFVGSIGLFLSLLFLFIRFLPMISISEIRAMLPEAEVKEKGETV